jgi:hypothetical protein
MPTHLSLDITGPGSVYLLLVLGFLALIVVNLLIALVEGVALTLLNWNPFRPSMTVSVIMNLTSGILNGILLIILQHTPLVWLPVSFVISLLLEGFILMYFKRDALRQNILFVFIINLISYIILILPAYYFGIHR